MYCYILCCLMPRKIEWVLTKFFPQKLPKMPYYEFMTLKITIIYLIFFICNRFHIISTPIHYLIIGLYYMLWIKFRKSPKKSAWPCCVRCTPSTGSRRAKSCWRDGWRKIIPLWLITLWRALLCSLFLQSSITFLASLPSWSSSITGAYRQCNLGNMSDQTGL